MCAFGSGGGGKKVMAFLEPPSFRFRSNPIDDMQPIYLSYNQWVHLI